MLIFRFPTICNKCYPNYGKPAKEKVNKCVFPFTAIKKQQKLLGVWCIVINSCCQSGANKPLQKKMAERDDVIKRPPVKY